MNIIGVYDLFLVVISVNDILLTDVQTFQISSGSFFVISATLSTFQQHYRRVESWRAYYKLINSERLVRAANNCSKSADSAVAPCQMDARFNNYDLFH